MKKQQFELANIISCMTLSIFFLIFFKKNIFLFYLFGILSCTVNLSLWKMLIEQFILRKINPVDLLIFLTFKTFIIFSIFILINSYSRAFILPAITSFLASLFLVIFILLALVFQAGKKQKVL